MASPITVTYAHVDGVDTQLDIYLPSDAQGSLPVVLYFHGGGLFSGSRADILFPAWKDDVLQHGAAFISADHRLLIPITGFDILNDLKSLFAFLSSPSALAPHLPAGVTLDATRLAATGSSAGAYLARLCVLYVTPKPRCVWSLWGMGGDFFIDHWVQLHDHAFRLVGGAVDRAEIAHLVDPSASPAVSSTAPLRVVDKRLNDDEHRFRMFNWVYQTGEILDFLAGRPGLGQELRALPHGERAAAVPADLAVLFPQLLSKSDFVPTLLTHGDADTIVPVAESELTFQQLQAAGVDSQLTVIKGGEHGLTAAGKFPPVGADGAKEALKQGVDFMMKHLQ